MSGPTSNASTPERRAAIARDLATRLADIVGRDDYESANWWRMLMSIHDVLSETDSPATERLSAAAQILRNMYYGGRNFSDFYVYRGDLDTTIAENARLSAIMKELSNTLNAD
jgi:hypothetical protein